VILKQYRMLNIAANTIQDLEFCISLQFKMLNLQRKVKGEDKPWFESGFYRQETKKYPYFESNKQNPN